MKCFKCGYESQDNFNFCPICGGNTSGTMPFVINPAADLVLKVIKDKLFLAICILMSVSTVLAASFGSFNVINILITVFLWLTFAKGTKNIADDKHLRCISGTVYAYYVIVNVASIICIVCGVIVSVLLSVLSESVDFDDALLELEEMGINFEIPLDIARVSGFIAGAIFVFMGIIFLLISIFGIRRIHKFVKSVYKSIQDGNIVLDNPIGARNALIFFAICEGLSAISGGNNLLIFGCSCASMIITIILIHKYFLTTNQQYQ